MADDVFAVLLVFLLILALIITPILGLLALKYWRGEEIHFEWALFN